MKQIVSSSATAFYKRGIPIILVGFLCLGLLGSVSKGSASISQLALGLVAFGSVAAVILYLCRSLKEVSVDEQALYISDGKREERIPFAQVESVSQGVWQRGSFETVTITFKIETIFGPKIVFLPSFRFATFTENPIVGELNGMIMSRTRTDFWP